MPSRVATEPKLLPHEIRRLERRSRPVNNVVNIRQEPAPMPSAKSPDKAPRRSVGSKTVDMEIYTTHTKTVRYRTTEPGAPLTSVYVEKSAMADAARPPKRIRVTVDFL